MITLAGIKFDERDLIRRVLMNLPRAKRKHLQQERWVVVHNRFAVGSTVAYALCREFGLDPEEKI